MNELETEDCDLVFGLYIPSFCPRDTKYTRWMRFKDFWNNHVAEPLAWAGLTICIAVTLNPDPVYQLIKLLLGIE